MCIIVTAAPPSKHLFTEMSFSPEGKLQVDISELRDLLSELIDEKFGYSKPLVDYVRELRNEVNKQKKIIHESQSKFSAFQKDFHNLQEENKSLRQ